MPIDHRIDVKESIKNSIICRDINQFRCLLSIINLTDAPRISRSRASHSSRSIPVIPDIDNVTPTKVYEHRPISMDRHELIAMCKDYKYLDPLQYLTTEIESPSRYELLRIKAKNIETLTLEELQQYCYTDRKLSKRNIDYIHKFFLDNYQSDPPACANMLYVLLNHNIDIPIDVVGQVSSKLDGRHTQLNLIDIYYNVHSGNNPSYILPEVGVYSNNISYNILNVLLCDMKEPACVNLLIKPHITNTRQIELIISKLSDYGQSICIGKLRHEFSRVPNKNSIITKISLLTKVDKDIRQKLVTELLGNIAGITILVE